MGNTLLDELRRFFVGGGPQLEDITYSGVPADTKVCVILLTCTHTSTHSILFDIPKILPSAKGPILAKYGMKTKSTGSVQLRVHIVHQSRCLCVCVCVRACVRVCVRACVCVLLSGM